MSEKKNETQSSRWRVETANPLSFARMSETIEIAASDLVGVDPGSLASLHVHDSRGQEILCQSLDSDGYGRTDSLIFQADYGPGEEKAFTISTGERRRYLASQFKAYGRFVRERYDDFVWENDKVAHRMYGKALETWIEHPLASSTVDIWSKRTGRLVANDWLMTDDYHEDRGEGADFYSAGMSRGCGGNGIWAKGKLWVSRNFVGTRLLAGGPIRALFELVYEPFPVDGGLVGETKRISLDAGRHFTRYRSFYRGFTPTSMASAAGIKKVAGERMERDASKLWICSWEPMEMNGGEQGIALIADPELLAGTAEDELNWLAVSRIPDSSAVTHWAGFCWDRAGHFDGEKGWRAHVGEFAQGLSSPISIKVSRS